MFIYTVEEVQDTTGEQASRYIVRVPDAGCRGVGIGAASPALAFAGCLALWLGFPRHEVEDMIAARERGF
jgi:hypothetical protein